MVNTRGALERDCGFRGMNVVEIDNYMCGWVLEFFSHFCMLEECVKPAITAQTSVSDVS